MAINITNHFSTELQDLYSHTHDPSAWTSGLFATNYSKSEQLFNSIKRVYANPPTRVPIAIISPISSKKHPLNTACLPAVIWDTVTDIFTRFHPTKIHTRGVTNYADEHLIRKIQSIQERISLTTGSLGALVEALGGLDHYLNTLIKPFLPNREMYGDTALKERDRELVQLSEVVVFLCNHHYQLRQSDIELINMCVESGVPVFIPGYNLVYTATMSEVTPSRITQFESAINTLGTASIETAHVTGSPISSRQYESYRLTPARAQTIFANIL